MNAKMLLGPLLGLENDTLYTVCFLSNKTTAAFELKVNRQRIPFEEISQTPRGFFWRAEIQLNTAEAGCWVSYEIECEGVQLSDRFRRSQWRFYMPGKSERPRIAYASCNGFSSESLLKKITDPYHLWGEMKSLHEENPFSLLLMGGDQLYADEIWSSSATPMINRWNKFEWEKKIKYTVGPRIERELDRFYERLYIKHWNHEDMAQMMASIPTLMMWDDHDIFDGWGSHPPDLQECEVFQTIFQYARKYFELFQIRSDRNRTLLNPDGNHFSWAVSFSDFLILGLDHRSDRTRTRVMHEDHWQDVKTWLTKHKPSKHFLILSALPVVYRSFDLVRTFFDFTTSTEELEDDVYDHWTSQPHQGERMKFIMNLLGFLEGTKTKAVIISGDVHVGGLGLIKDHDRELELYQVISSGIVHSPPSMLQWLGIQAVTSDSTETLGKGEITAEILKPFGSNSYIRSRNFVTFNEGTDGKLWVNWQCEKDMRPVYAI